jgi:GNAT superfamily N-acetyltransferase
MTRWVNDLVYSPITNGHIAAIVTSLEMTEKPPLRPMPVSDLRLERWKAPALEKYRLLNRRVGEPWLWFQRVALSDDELSAIIHSQDVGIWAVIDRRGVEVGLLELDFRQAGNCEVVYLGLVPPLNGKGYGKWLIAMALQLAWSRSGLKRVWLNTCTTDAPAALGFYIKSGFTPYQRQLETFPDPRLTGLIPRQAAPQIPLIA